MSAHITGGALLARSGSGLGGFLTWWGRGLAAWLPAGMRRLLIAGDERLWLQVQGDAVQLLHQGEGGPRDVAALPLPLPAETDPLQRVLQERARALPRWLLLPDSAGLRRTLLLPAAARERLREVLGFEIERQTPFALADVLHDGRVVQVREDGQLQVELVVLPRARFDAAVARLGGAAKALAGVDLQSAEGRALGVNLLPPAQRSTRGNAWRWWNLGLALVAILALALAMAQLLDNRRAAAQVLKTSMQTREAQARMISSERQRLLDTVEGEAYLRAQRNDHPPVVEVMQALAQRLPDGTYLEKLSVDGDQLSMIGLSSQAAALVGKLEGAPQWSAPALSGALQQDPRTRMDRFTLVAQLAGKVPATPSVPAAPASGEPR
ncbi:MAG: PilN domain-containing protein [Xanthomonadaceae bacterium]|nr:PilN domain-containing protein [Xanthomonadaceae bacterium]